MNFYQRQFILHFIGLLILSLVLIAASRYNYLLFHTLAELISVIIAVTVFVLALNTRKFMKNGYLLFLGVASLNVAIIDLLHTLSFQGMPIFPGYDANLPTQLWVLARSIQAISLIIALLFLRKKAGWKSLAGFTLSSIILVALIFGRLFPDAYVEGRLTPFKIVAEYVISGVLVIALLLLRKRKQEFDPGVLNLLSYSIMLMILSEISFTMYTDVTGISNLIGHILKIGVYYTLYLAIVHRGLTRPYSVLFKELTESNKLKDLFIDIMRHDMLGPLGVIRHKAEMRKDFEGIQKNSDHVIGMIESAHKLANFKGSELHRVETHLTNLLEEAVDRQKIHADEKGQIIKLEVKTDIKVLVDPMLIEVFVNMISNAIKYSPENAEIVIKAENQQDRIRIYFIDRGEGIADAHKKSVFERFKRLSKGGVKGLGLGLAISKEIVTAHDGQIWVEDNPSGGSIFVVELPKHPGRRQISRGSPHRS